MAETLIARLITRINPITIVIVIAGISLIYSNKQLATRLDASNNALALTKSENSNLANQLENAQIQAEAYKEQVDKLNLQILVKMQQAEERSNEIITELQSVKEWANTLVPANVSRLLNNRNSELSNTKTKSSNVPDTHDLRSSSGNRKH
ncbi:hypothetical protein NYR75_02925 [Actinobacillus equuli subsp. haemolyticus]|uniref:Phage lysis regulatory protein, LysB family n=1 Tax=Actinobacillus equuli subsp. equuli TaxID=202947 RepID=A0A9X4JDE4_ACTEU|nr:hypothetical protein [Actinobacillus equuli]MDE8034649.1 hypothetical protein [Actinobacillus equuli subsp. equuli]WGE63794.1 hypothetical protein NYR75_02925 [Actinobacillus equuli subsp. haemolyticus]